MKSILILLFLTLSLNLHAQEKKPETFVYTAALQKGQQFSFGEKSLRFKEVVSDSRCPRNVTCIWPGEAKVLLEVRNRRINIDLIVKFIIKTYY